MPDPTKSMTAADELRPYLNTDPRPKHVGCGVVVQLLAEHDEQRDRAVEAAAELAEVRAEMANPFNRDRIATAVQRAHRQRDEAVDAAEAELEEYKADLKAVNAELERYRGLDAAAKELLARNVEFGTRADNAEAKCEDLEDEVERLREQIADATALLGHFVDHEDQPCRLDHHGACQEHGGSSLRPCDVAAGRALLARIRGGDFAAVEVADCGLQGG